MGKLIRDKIPEIINKNGETCSIRILEDAEYYEALKKKLVEEEKEFLLDETPEELADLLEVIYALGDYQGYSEENLNDIRFKKYKEKGAFNKRIYLESE